MKKTIIASILIFLFISLLGQSNEKSEVRKLKPFDKIIISKGINVTLQEGEEPEAEIVILNAKLSEVIIEQKGKEVTIRMKSKSNKNVAVSVYLTFQNLTEISAKTGGKIDSEDVIETNQLKIDAALGAEIELEVEVNKLIVLATTSSVRISGTAETIDINTTSGGKYLGFELECKEANVRATTSSIAQIFVTEKLEAFSSSGATVEYIGEPLHVHTNILLGGKVIEITDDEDDDE